MDKTILVTGASGIVGYGILKSLQKNKEPLKLIGSSSHEESVAPEFCDIFEKAPLTKSEGYFEWLKDVIQRHHVGLVIPSLEIDVFTWNEHRDFFSKLGVKALLNDQNLIRLCKDKWLFYKELEQKKSPYIIKSSCFYSSQVNFFPFIVKPRMGSASKGVSIIRSHEELQEYDKKNGTSYIIQPIIGDADHEYTVSAFFDMKSNLLAYMPLCRKLSTQGFTEVAHTVNLFGIEKALKSLAQDLNPVGPTNFQFRTVDGQLRLLEINPRISSATSIRTAFGYNESQMSIDYFLNHKKICQPCLRHGSAVRYTEDIIKYDRVNI